MPIIVQLVILRLVLLQTTISTVMPVTFTGATNSTTSAGANHYNTLRNNKIDGGYYGVRLYGSSADYGRNNQLINNEISNVYYYGIYSYYQDSTVISGNSADLTVSGSATNSYGLYAPYTFNADIISNNIKANSYGLYLTHSTTTEYTRTKKNQHY